MTDENLFDLSEKVAVVTGGGRGIGRAIAEGLAAHGANVIVCGRNESTLRETVTAIGETYAKSDYVVTDVASEASVVRLRQETVDKFGRVDILVNNAGVNPFYDRAENTTLAQWQMMIDVNLTGVFLCCREIGSEMLKRKSGSIVNVTSIAGSRGLPRTGAYCAAKGGVEMLSRSLALDWAKHNVRVNTVAPGYVETDMTQGLIEHPVLSERLRERTPLGRLAAPEEMVGAVVYLASSASTYVTGQTIGVDGGWTAA